MNRGMAERKLRELAELMTSQNIRTLKNFGLLDAFQDRVNVLKSGLNNRDAKTFKSLGQAIDNWDYTAALRSYKELYKEIYGVPYRQAPDADYPEED